jgi:chromate transporter
MILAKLFLAFLKIGLFAFGGAYSFVPLIEREVVANNNWLTKSEFMEILGIVKVFPGAISIKFATYTGYKVAGIPGAIVANTANIMAPVIFIMVVSLVYLKYKEVPFVKGSLSMIQYAVFAMIIAVGLQLVDKTGIFELKNALVVLVAFAFFILTKIHPAFIIIGAALYGGIIEMITSN